jgi:hypothetical protein
MIFLARFMIRQEETQERLVRSEEETCVKILPENAKVWNFKEGYV